MRLLPVDGADAPKVEPGARGTSRDRARDEGLIVFYFARQCMFERSTFGDMLERAQTNAFDSTGRRVKLASRSWNWQPEGYATVNGRLYRVPTAPLPPMPVHPEHGDGPGYEVDDDQLVRFARASRRMGAVERTNPAAKRTLEAYYGDRGNLWAVFGADREGDHGKPIKGAGPGAIAALYILTPLGRDFLERERRRSDKARAPARPGEDTEHLTDDEVLGIAFALQAAQPNKDRRAILNRVRDEAEAMLLEAQAIWYATAPPPKAKRVVYTEPS